MENAFSTTYVSLIILVRVRVRFRAFDVCANNS